MESPAGGNAIFFILGSGRSGSTLLRTLLLGHSRLFIPPETWFIIPLTEHLPLDRELSPAEALQAADIITGHYRWPDFDLDPETFRQSVARLDRPHLRDIIDVVYEHLLNDAGKQRIGDKTPPYVAILPELARLYPEAKFIHLIRDGRDVAISYIEMGYECRYYDGLRFDWIASLRRAREYSQSALSARILEVRYEELVAEPELELGRICAFLGEDFEPVMLERRPRLDTVPERERRIHGKLDRPLSRDAIAAWRGKLSALECFCMEACLRRELQEFGYKLHFAGRGWRPLLSAAGFVLNTAAPLLDRAVPFLKRRKIIPARLYI